MNKISKSIEHGRTNNTTKEPLMKKITKIWTAALAATIIYSGEAKTNYIYDVNNHNKTHYVNKDNKSFSKNNIALLRWTMPQLDNKSLNWLNKNIGDLLLSANSGTINWEQFLFNFLELSKQYNITNIQLISVLSDYIKKGIISNNIRRSLEEQISINLKWILDTYPKDKIANYFRDLEKLYEDWQLTEKEVKKNFKEYFENKSEKNDDYNKSYDLTKDIVIWSVVIFLIFVYK